MPKFAPRNESGLLPYVVIVWRWGRQTSSVFYAQDAAQAKRIAVPRGGPGEYVTRARRATPEDMETLSVNS